MRKGWFSALIAKRLRVYYLDHSVGPVAIAEMLAELELDLASWPAARPRLALYEVHGQPDFGLTYRRALAAVLKRHEGKLSGSAGVALVTSSSIARGLLTATFWLAPPRYPAFMTDSLDDGMLWLSGQAQCGDARAWTREYEHLKREHLERTRPRRVGGTR